jgi:hypothetical protein
MSSLYRTEDEIKKEFDKRFKGENGGGKNWYTDTKRKGISRDEDGNIQRDGLAWWMQWGESDGFAESAATRNADVEEAKGIKRAVRTSGLTEEQIRKQLGDGKLTADNVSGTITQAQQTRAEKPTPVQAAVIERGEKADARAVTAQEDSTAVARETLSVTRENNENQMTLAANQMELARLDNKFDRETASADRNLTLQIAQMDSQLADKRLAYDRETRSMDKRDRMIAQLMSGLGSLGGAFTL